MVEDDKILGCFPLIALPKDKKNQNNDKKNWL
jgi:hypothetical protein